MKCAAKLGGTSIAGATVYVPTQEFYVYWHTDGSQDSFYGFKIDSVTQELEQRPDQQMDFLDIQQQF